MIEKEWLRKFMMGPTLTPNGHISEKIVLVPGLQTFYTNNMPLEIKDWHT